MLSQRILFVSGLIITALAPGVVAAHVTGGIAGGFESGVLHPLLGPDHFLAMLAVGIWGAQMGGRAIWMLPVAFPLVMSLGAVAGIAGFFLPGVEIGIAASVLVLGGAILKGWRPAPPVSLAVIAVFAVFHGYAHGVELPGAADRAAYIVGFVVATGLIHIAGIALGLALHKPLDGRIARGLGAVIAAGGVYFLAA